MNQAISHLELEDGKEKVSFYRSIIALESNIFEAFGSTPQESYQFLIDGLRTYALEVEDIDEDFYEPYRCLIKTQKVSLGDCMCISNE